MAVKAVDLPFREQSEFLRRKLNLSTEAWTDVYAEQHDWAFAVAGANRNAIVEDFREAIEKVINDGTTIQDFRKDFDAIVERHGWSYNGGRNWRSRVIYDTNLNQSYNAGRYEQLMAVREDRPYWMYLHSDAVENPRPQHQAWNGMVLRWDDPWWQHHFPSNGWGCQCRVIALDEADLKAMGKSGPDKAPPINMVEKQIGQRSPGGPFTVLVPEGVDPGFEYRPGGSRLRNKIMPPKKPGTGTEVTPVINDKLPEVRTAPINPLPESASKSDAVDAFLQQLGQSIDQPSIFRDVLGEANVVGREMFDAYAGAVNELPLFAASVANPDEIYTYLDVDPRSQKAVTRKRFITRFIVDGVRRLYLMDFGRDGWWAHSGEHSAADRWRAGERVYQRGDE